MQAAELAQILGSSTCAEVEVTGVTHNSRWVKPGDAFVALRGASFDGHRFLDEVAAAGAALVIGAGLRAGETSPVPYLTVAEPRLALAQAAAALAGNPADELTVIGVTGTDGKTTTSLLLTHILREAGRQVGVISTVGFQGVDGQLRQYPAHFTTPEAPQVQEILADLVAQGADTVVLETSSHALAQERVGGINFDVGVWTHLSPEHLDFHKTMDEYFAAKRLLIERSRLAVLNADDPWSEQLDGVAGAELRYSINSTTADVCAVEIVEGHDGLQFWVKQGSQSIAVTLPMLGEFNVANATAALTAASALGIDLAAAAQSLASFAGVAGRMQFVPRQADEPRVIVDFAHTPDALAKALAALRTTTMGALWCVIGAAGGARDETRIAPMGQRAAQLADRVVFTEDDTYDTSLDFLLGELNRGAAGVAGASVETVPDRREAIAHVMTAAASEDTVLLAGKGHESELMRTPPIAWDEVAQARAALDRRHF